MTVGEFAVLFVRGHVALQKTGRQRARVLRDAIATFAQKPFDEVTREELYLLRAAWSVQKPMANHRMALIRTLWKHAVELGVVLPTLSPPTVVLRSFKLTPRKRYVHMGDELDRLLPAIDAEPAIWRTYFHLMLATALNEHDRMSWRPPRDRSR